MSDDEEEYEYDDDDVEEQGFEYTDEGELVASKSACTLKPYVSAQWSYPEIQSQTCRQGSGRLYDA
jgi:hypothetical protein